MPLTYSTKSSQATASCCLHCHEHTRGKKPFCNDECKILWLEKHHPWHQDWRGTIQVANERRALGITPEALEWKRKLSLSRSFGNESVLKQQLKASLEVTK